MKISLLSLKVTGTKLTNKDAPDGNYIDMGGNVNSIDRKVLYHLSVDRSFSYVCADVKKRESFLSVISELTCDKNEIEYRQDIIRDFQKNPGSFERLAALYERFEELRLSQKALRKNEYLLNANKADTAFASKNILQAQAVCLKRALLFVKKFGELLSVCNLRSAGLINFSSACREICENPEFQNLLGFCGRYEQFSVNDFLDFKFSLNEHGHIEEYALIDHGYIYVSDPELKKKGLPFFKKSEVNYRCERVFPGKNDFYEGLLITALSDISGLFASLSEQIFDKFSAVYRELEFYFVALKYIEALVQKNIPYCFPEITADRNVKVKSLYDLYLLMSTDNPGKIIPNDFCLSDSYNSVIVYGDNGSGKTSFLRSVGTMQILGQAGLPVPCECAKICLYSQIASQFSEAEKEFCGGNEAGRFEQETRELAALADELSDGAFLLLNETFQSTAYEEGAQGLYNILEYFSDCNIRCVLVTHLRELEKMSDKDKCLLLYIENGHVIIKM